MNVMRWDGYVRTVCTKCGADLDKNPKHKCDIVASNWFQGGAETNYIRVTQKKKVYKRNRNT